MNCSVCGSATIEIEVKTKTTAGEVWEVKTICTNPQTNGCKIL